MDLDVYTLSGDRRDEIDFSQTSNTKVVDSGVLDDRQIGLSYGMLDEDGLPYEPVKLKTFALCCH